MLTIPKAAKRDRAFGNHHTFETTMYTAVFDQEFDLINLVPLHEGFDFHQFRTLEQCNDFLRSVADITIGD